MSVACFIEYFKGKSALTMFDEHANLKYKFGNRFFLSEAYYESTVGLNKATIKNTFRNNRSMMSLWID